MKVKVRGAVALPPPMLNCGSRAWSVQNYTVTRMKALPHREVASAIERVWAPSSKPAVKLAFELLVLTATRSGEFRMVRLGRRGHPHHMAQERRIGR